MNFGLAVHRAHQGLSSRKVPRLAHDFLLSYNVDVDLHPHNLCCRMRKGEFEEGSRCLRAKIDMASPNINMRDPAIYRSAAWMLPSSPSIITCPAQITEN
jgi:glutamyl/glutaminyl-tRNA synthetase